MSEVGFRRGLHVSLRPLVVQDAAALARWRNSPNLADASATPWPVTQSEEEETISYWSKSRTTYVFGVEYTDGTLIGTIGLHDIKWPHRTAQSATMIGEEEHWGQGRATEAKMLLLDFAFNALDLFEVMAHAPDSGRAFSHLTKCGFVEVGRVPGWYRDHKGGRMDDVIHLVTQDRWRPLWDQYLASGRKG